MTRRRIGGPGSRLAWLACATICALLWTGCTDARSGSGSGSGPDEPLLVMAAASLGTAMPALIDRFEARTGASVDLALGATGNLAAQISNGAPADLFFAADETTVQRLTAGGALRPSSARTYALGQLVLVWRDGVEPPASVRALRHGDYEVVAIANPEIAPYGAAARETLRALGLWETLAPRLVQGESVAQAYQLVRTGNADVALVARSVVEAAGGNFIAVDARHHAPIRQAAGIVEGSIHSAAEEFLDYVLSEEGQAILAEHGFLRAPH